MAIIHFKRSQPLTLNFRCSVAVPVAMAVSGKPTQQFLSRLAWTSLFFRGYLFHLQVWESSSFHSFIPGKLPAQEPIII